MAIHNVFIQVICNFFSTLFVSKIKVVVLQSSAKFNVGVLHPVQQPGVTLGQVQSIIVTCESRTHTEVTVIRCQTCLPIRPLGTSQSTAY